MPRSPEAIAGTIVLFAFCLALSVGWTLWGMRAEKRETALQSALTQTFVSAVSDGESCYSPNGLNGVVRINGGTRNWKRLSDYRAQVERDPQILLKSLKESMQDPGRASSSEDDAVLDLIIGDYRNCLEYWRHVRREDLEQTGLIPK